MATWPTIIDDDGTGTTGTTFDNAFFTAIKAYIDTLPPVANLWTNVPYAASNFTASAGMTWTVAAGNVAFNRYTVLGTKTLIWLVYIENSSLSGTAGPQLYIKLPAGLTGVYKRGVVATTQLFDGSSSRGWARVNVDGLSLIIEKDPSSNFAFGPVYVEFTIILEIT